MSCPMVLLVRKPVLEGVPPGFYAVSSFPAGFLLFTTRCHDTILRSARLAGSLPISFDVESAGLVATQIPCLSLCIIHSGQISPQNLFVDVGLNLSVFCALSVYLELLLAEFVFTDCFKSNPSHLTHQRPVFWPHIQISSRRGQIRPRARRMPPLMF